MENSQVIWLGLVVLLISVAGVVWPLFVTRREVGERRIADSHTAYLKERADLLEERRKTYAAIRDLEMEYRVDKVNEAEFSRQRSGLVAHAVDVLKALDDLTGPAHDPVEELIAAYQTGQPSFSSDAQFCPNCGEKTHPDDLFCGNCGQSLS